jgi:hypothetical protein
MFAGAWRFEDTPDILMILKALAFERAAATRTVERVLHDCSSRLKLPMLRFTD